MKKLLKILVGLGFFLFLFFMIIYFIFNEKKPLIQAGSEMQADALASQMLTALNKPAWDSTNYVQWTFREKNKYVWDRSRKLVEIKLKKYRVLMDLDNWDRAKAFSDGQELSGKKKNKAINSAWKNFCNDAFWLEAPYKVFDKDTERHMLDPSSKYGNNAFMLTYNSGGVTPGDSYLWVLDKQGVPMYYKMWVQIIPIGGIQASWEGWKDMPQGAKISTSHKIGSFTIPVSNVKTGDTYSDLELKADPFLNF